MAKNMKNITAEQEEPAGASLKARRAGCYVFLILISFICLFWFYVLFINATRSNSQLARGFTALPSVNLGANLHNLFSGTLPVISGLCNSCGSVLYGIACNLFLDDDGICHPCL